MQLIKLTRTHIDELASWFNQPSPGNKFIDFYKDPSAWFHLVENQVNRRGFVALIDGRIVGFADIEFDNKGDASFAFGIKPELRGKGFGRQLLKEIVDYAKDHDAKTIQAGIEKANETSKHLLEDFGFSLAVKDDEVDEYIMEIY